MKIPKNRTTRPILDPQSQHDLKNMRGNTGLFVVIQLYTGLRMMEICTLKWADLIDENGQARQSARFYISKQSKKGNNYGFFREMPIHNDLKISIEEEFNRAKPKADDYIFVSQSNNKGKGHISRQGMCQRIKKVLSGKAGVEYPASHALRKTFAYSLYIANGKDIAIVREALGHTSDEMTMRYLKLGLGDMNTIYQKLNYGY
jgi:integrase